MPPILQPLEYRQNKKKNKKINMKITHIPIIKWKNTYLKIQN